MSGRKLDKGAFMFKSKLISRVAVIMLIAVFSVAGFTSCKKNQATSSTLLSGEMPIDLTQDISQFAGKTFKSVDVLEDVGDYSLWVKISEDSTIKYQGAGNTEPNFANSKELVISRGMGQDYVFQGKAFVDTSEQSGKLTFEPDGTLTVKFISGTSYDGRTVKCKLVK